jgi:thioredoxin-related protein
VDHQQYKLIATVNFVIYPVEKGRMLPGYHSAEKFIGITEGSIEECKEFISDFVKINDKEFVKVRG